MKLKMFKSSFHMKDTSKTGTEDGNKETSRMIVTLSQLVPVMITNLMLMVFGMSSGYPTILIPGLSNSSNGGMHLNEEQISWIGSINMLSLPLGCVLSGLIAQAIGRKITMQISSILITICWIIFGFCNDVWQLYAALAVSGFTAGLCESPVLSYVAEISQPHLRGSFLSSATLSITLGIFLEFLLGTITDWRTISLYSAIPSVTFCILSFFIPESPYWCVIKNKLQNGRKSLVYVRGWSTSEEIEQEFQDIVASNKSQECHSIFKLNDYIKLQFINPFLLICFIFLVYNFTGLYTIQVNAVKIFETLEVPLDEYDATVILGVVQFLGCLTCVIVIPYTGKRLLTFIAVVIAAVSIIVVATYAHLTNIKYLYSPNVINNNSPLIDHKWIPLLFIFLSTFTLNCGIRTLPWNLSVEVFPTETRSIATGALGAVFYFIAFGCNKAFLEVVAAITLPGVFWCYGAMGLISVVILYVWLPETEGKSLDEIKAHFTGRTKLDNRVK